AVFSFSYGAIPVTSVRSVFRHRRRRDDRCGQTLEVPSERPRLRSPPRTRGGRDPPVRAPARMGFAHGDQGARGLRCRLGSGDGTLAAAADPADVAPALLEGRVSWFLRDADARLRARK